MSDAAVVVLPGRGPFPSAQHPPKDKPRRSRETMSEEDVLKIISDELKNAVGQDGDELSTERGLATDYYNGKPLGTERSGHSTLVSRNVMEAIEWVTPALLRIFVASDRIAIIEPTKPGEAEAEAAEVATSYITHVWYKDNDGFSLLHDFVKDGLLCKIGWIKRWWQEKIVQETESYSGLTPIEYQEKYAELAAKGEVEVLESREYVDPVEGPLHDCTLQTTMEELRVILEGVPPEEIVFSPKCKRGYMPFVCHKRSRTFSDLLQAGYDEDSILECLGDGNALQPDEALRRQQPVVNSMFDDPVDDAMRSVYCEESYLLMDFNQDGIAELCKVMTAQDATRVLLRRDGKPDIEAIDEIPLVWWTPVPMPHTLAGGHSLADLIMDLQKIKTALLRQMLDNIYLTNNPRIIVGDNASNENTQHDILHSQPGGIIRARDPTGIVPHVTPFVAGSALPLVELLDQMQEVRTGVARHNQGLNPDDLNKTATGVSLLQQAASQRCELIARILGRSVQELVRGILGLVRRHQQQARIVMVTGKPLTMDPKLWREEMDVSVNVGLGTGSRDKITQDLMAVLQLQNGIVQLQGGPSGPLVYPKNVFDALERLTEVGMGFKESFFADPSQPPPAGTPPQPEKPDPEMAKVQGQMQLQKMKIEAQQQMNQQKAMATVAVSGEQAKQEVAIERDRTNSEMQLEREQAAFRMALEQKDAENRYKLEILQLQHDLAIAKMKADMQQRESDARIAREALQAQQQPAVER